MNVIGKSEVLEDSTDGPSSTQEKRLYTDTANTLVDPEVDNIE